MSTFALLLVTLAAAFAVALALRAHADVDAFLRELKAIQAKLSTAQADLSTLRRRFETVRLELAELGRPPGEIQLAEPGADPRVYVQQLPGQPHDRVILSNRSAAAARDVSVHIDCAGGGSPFLREFADRSFPVELLEQGVPYIVLAAFPDDCEPPVDARLEWRDPDGTHQVREFPLRW